MKKLTMIIPCLNERGVLPAYYREMKRIRKELPVWMELLFVDDGSRDGTDSYIKKLAEKDPEVQYLLLTRNFGKEAAMYAGFCQADGDYIGVMDADLQDPPSLLPRMLRLLEEGNCDCVAVRREDREGEGFIRSLLSGGFYHLYNALTGMSLPEGTRDYRLMTREVKQAVTRVKDRTRFTKGLFEWLGFRVIYLPCRNTPRRKGKTKWSLHALYRYALDGIMCGLEELPFPSLFSGTLLILTAVARGLAGAFGAGHMGEKPSGSKKPGDFTWLLLLSDGLKHFTLGFQTLLLFNTYKETRRRPVYILRESSLQKKQTSPR